MIEVIPNWHPVFVHFTVALMSVSGVMFIIAYFARARQYREGLLKVAEWNFWVGSTVTIATVLAGWYAYNTVAHDTPSHAAMTLHRNWALGTFAMIIVLAFWLWKSRRSGAIKLSFPFVIVITAFLGLLGTTAWHGGEVVYRHGLGVMSMPKSEGDGHAHEHNDKQSLNSGLSNEHETSKPVVMRNAGSEDGVKNDKQQMHDDHNHGEYKH